MLQVDYDWNEAEMILWYKVGMKRFYLYSNNMITFSLVQKKDIPVLADIYARAFNTQWEAWNKKTSKAIIEYRYAKKIKLKVAYKGKIIWALFSDVKPLFNGNILNDGDIFIDPEFQKLWIGRWLFLYGMQYAKKKFNVVGWDFYTFKNSFQYKRYKRIGFSPSKKRVMMSGNIDDVLKKMKQRYMK